MAYTTLASMLNAIPATVLTALTDDSGAATYDTAKVSAAISRADQLIDTYLRGKHTLPLSPVPDIIAGASIDLAKYYLYERRRDLDADEGNAKLYKQTLALLEEIRDGKLLIDDTTSFQNQGEVAATNKASTDRVYTSDVMDCY